MTGLEAAEPFDLTKGQFGFVFDRAAIGMALVALDGSFLRVNDALCRLVGRKQDELQATTWQAITHPEDIDVGLAELTRSITQGGESFQLEKRYLHSAGHTVWAILTVSLVREDRGAPSYLFTQVVDVTDLRRTARAEHHLATIAESSQDAILAISLDGTILAWNNSAEGLYGYARADVVGQHLSLVVPPELRGDIEERLAQARNGTDMDFETVFRTRRDRRIHVTIQMATIYDELDRPTGVSLIARDMNQQLELESALSESSAALRLAVARARDAEARSRQFLADAAHQLRTPMASIQACADALLRETTPLQSDVLLGHLGDEAARASRLINALLRMARLDQGEELVRVPCAVMMLCRREADRAMALRPDLLFDFHGEDVEPARHLDANAVREIVANLFDNARRYARSRIVVTVEYLAEVVELRVADDGPGVESKNRERIFERFVTVGAQRGSGLGLSIARELARAHGGDLSYAEGAFVTRLFAEDRSTIAEELLDS